MSTHPIRIESAGGEYMESVLVVSWAAKPGDKVKAGQLLVVVETAKAATELEAEHDGWLAEILFAEGQEAPVGAVLGTISDTEPDLTAASAPTPDKPAEEPARVEASAPSVKPKRVVASPLARRIAKQAGVDLTTVSGTGPRGRIKQRDVMASLEKRGRPVPAAAPAPSLSTSQETVVLLHGFGADRTAWRQVTPLLPREMRAVALDLAGHGARADIAAQCIEDIALDIGAQLEAAGIESAHIAGHSLGGGVALALAGLGRVAVRSMTLLAPAGLGPEINAGFIAGLTRTTTPEALERWLAVMVGDPGVLPPGYAAAALRQLDRQGNRDRLEELAARLFADGTQVFDLGGVLARLAVPARIVWGQIDRVIPPAHAARAPGTAAVHMLAGIGHTVAIEAPALTARLISETVRSAG